MPLYDYHCDDCGPFRSWRPMSEAAAPEHCPDCDAEVQRAMTAPFIANMNPHTRIAHQRNEKSAHEPRMVKKSGKAHDHAPGHHHHGHGHGRHGHAHGPSRPWMIGH